MNVLRRFQLGALFCWIGASSVLAQAWPSVRGDQGLTASPLGGLTSAVLGVFDAGNNDGVAWSFSTNRAIRNSSPAVAPDGSIYVQTSGDIDASGQPLNPGSLLALDGNGNLLWSVQTGGYGDSSPALAPDGTIYVGTDYYAKGVVPLARGNLLAFNSDGSDKWQYSLPDVVRSAPAIGSDGTVYVGCLDRGLYAINPAGTLKWVLPTGGVIFSALAIAGDGTIYFGDTDTHLDAINPDGTVKWQYPTQSFVTSPALSPDGTIYFGNYADGLGGAPQAQLFYALNPDTTLRWSFLAGGGIIGAPAIGPDGNIFFGAEDGLLYALTRDGEKMWTFSTGGPIYSSPAIAGDGTISFGSQDGNFYTLNTNGTLLARLETGKPVSSSAAIDDNGRLYVGSENGTLYAIEGTAPANPGGWGMFGRSAQHHFSFPFGQVPDAPANVRASDGIADRIGLSWDPSSDLVTYEVWRGATNLVDRAEKLAEFRDSTSYEDETGAAGVLYYYWIRARNSAGLSPFSEVTTGSRPLPPVGGIIWKYPVGNLLYVPGAAIAPDGTVYIGGNQLHAFRSDGVLLWKTPIEGEGVLEGAPAIAEDGTIYTGSNDYNVYAFNPDGTIKWAVRGEERSGAFVRSPALGADAVLYIGAYDNLLYAINPDGTIKWTYRTGSDSSSAPIDSAPALSADGNVYFSAIDQLYALDQNGLLQWYQNPAGSYGPVIGAKGEIYSANDDGTLAAIQPDGSRKWLFQTGAPAAGATPVLGPDGTIYCGTSGSNLFAITASGELKWKFTAGGAVGGAPSVAADGTVYFGSSDHFLYAVDHEGNLLWKVETGDIIQSATAIGPNGSVYVVSNDGFAYCVRGSSPLAESVWPTFHQNNRRTGLSPVITQLPVAPNAVDASQGTFPDAVRVEWESADWAAGYDLMRNTVNDLASALPLASNVTGTSYFDSSANYAQHYFYWVRSINSAGKSSFSQGTEGYQDLPMPGEDDQWSLDFYNPGMSTGSAPNAWKIRALVVAPNGDLIAGGGFSSMAGLPNTQGLARWNGVEWTSIGGGIKGGTVYSILATESDIYVGGSFQFAADGPIVNIARWDGASWHALGAGLSGGAVRALGMLNGKLLAGGAFTHSGAGQALYLALWDGSHWMDLGTGFTPVFATDERPPIYAIQPMGDSLYIGGGIQPILRWDGSALTPLGGNLPGTVTALGTFHGELIAGIEPAPIPNPLLIWHWDGTQWLPLGSVARVSVGSIYFLFSDASSLYAGGLFTGADSHVARGFARWDGVQWQIPNADLLEGSFAMAGDGVNLFLSTTLTSLMAGGVNGILRFDGEIWATMGGGIQRSDSAINAILPVPGGVLVGGGFDNQTLALWDRKKWNVEAPVARTGFSVTALLQTATNILVVTREINSFDGSTWSPITPSLPTQGLCIAQRGAELFVGHRAGIAKWDGTNWTNLGDGLNGSVQALALVGRDLYAGGTFTASGNNPVRYIARWDGNQWHPIDGDLNGPVFALAVDGGILYVGGQFNLAGTLPVRSVVIWDGIRWTTPPIDLLNPCMGVSCLATSSDGVLFVGGDLRPYGNPLPLFIVKWNGSRWLTLGSGLNSTPHSLAVAGADLYAGGEFQGAGGHSSVQFAHWHIRDSLLVPSISVATVIPSGTSLDYTIQIENPGDDPHANCVFRAKIPDGTRFIGGSNSAQPSGDFVILSLGDIAPHENLTATVSFKVEATNSFITLDAYSVSDSIERTYRGKAAYTSVVPSQKQSQSITMSLPPTGVLNEPILIPTSSSSGLPVTLKTLTGNATLIGNVLVPNSGDFITIRASQSGNDAFDAASDVDQTLTIIPPPQVSISSSNHEIALTWGKEYSQFNLESAPSVLGPWKPVTAQTFDNEEMTALIDASGGQTFFRLTVKP